MSDNNDGTTMWAARLRATDHNIGFWHPDNGSAVGVQLEVSACIDKEGTLVVFLDQQPYDDTDPGSRNPFGTGPWGTRIRVNVNDGAVFDQDTETGEDFLHAPEPHTVTIDEEPGDDDGPKFAAFCGREGCLWGSPWHYASDFGGDGATKARAAAQAAGDDHINDSKEG